VTEFDTTALKIVFQVTQVVGSSMGSSTSGLIVPASGLRFRDFQVGLLGHDLI
jgi:hypothetical protein